MEIGEALKILDNIALDWRFGKPARYEAYQTLKTFVLAQQQTTHAGVPETHFFERPALMSNEERSRAGGFLQ